MEKELCWVKVSTWTRIVAWFQIVGSLVGAMSFLILLDTFQNLAIFARLIKSSVIFNIYNDSGIVLLAALSILFALIFIISILLLVGSVHGYPHYLRAWMVFHIILTLISFGLVVVAAVELSNLFFILLIFFIPCGFSLCVVFLHLRDMQSRRGVRNDGCADILNLI